MPSRKDRVELLRGAIGVLSEAFGVELNDYAHSGGTCRCRTGAIQIPADLEGVMEGVFGFDSRPQARTHFRGRVRTAPSDVSYTALQVAQAYRFPAGTDGAGQTIAIVELGGGYSAGPGWDPCTGLGTPDGAALLSALKKEVL